MTHLIVFNLNSSVIDMQLNLEMSLDLDVVFVDDP